MTGLLHEKDFSRKTFLKGGALVVGVATVGFGVAGNASAAVPTPAGYNPDQAQADTYLTVNSDNTVTVTFGSPDWGHGLYTGVLMMVGEELDMDMSQLTYARPDTWINGTGGGGGQQRLQQPCARRARSGPQRPVRRCSRWPRRAARRYRSRASRSRRA